MFHMAPPISPDLTLETAVSRLAASPTVDGVLLTGSTANLGLTMTSDYDLLIVLDDPLPLHVGIGRLEGRLADLAFTSTDLLDRLVTAPAQAAGQPLAWPIVRWLTNGTIVFDRDGRLARAQAAAQAGALDLPLDEHAIYSVWFRANYNLRHARRLLASEDATVRLALDLRLLYSLYDLVPAYFIVRGLPWMGEKAAVRHWQAHDLDFLRLLEEALASGDRRQKVALYEELAARALEPAGGVWPPDATGLEFRPGAPFRPALVADGLALWARLIGEEDHGPTDRG
jgi:hypothetical protein